MLLCTAVSCGDAGFLGFLNQEIPLRIDAGIPLTEVRFGDGSSVTAALDTASPLTVISGANRSNGSSREGEFRLQDATRSGTTRFIFFEQRVYDLPITQLGLDTPVPVGALVGADLLRRFAVRLSYDERRPTVTLASALPDSSQELSADCDPAVLLSGEVPSPPCNAVVGIGRVGGGATVIGEQQINLPPTRVALAACLAPDPFVPAGDRAAAIETTGQPATALLHTALGVSVLARSALQRLRTRAEVIEDATPTTLYLPYGSETVTTATIEGIAIVGNATRRDAACGELARRRRLLLARRDGIQPEDDDRAGAAVASATGAVRVAVIDDESVLMSALRNELRPTVADVDLLVGGSLLQRFALTIDYPEDRAVLSCLSTAEDCRVIPACSRQGDAGPNCL